MVSTSLIGSSSQEQCAKKPEGMLSYYALFFSSGCPALLYQIVWQRALFTIYGVNIESVTIIVTIFMLGLGLGSLAGGHLSTFKGIHALRAFGIIEFSIGLFGICSLGIFNWFAQFTAGSTTATTGLVTFALLLLPTLLMGSTLPLLVAHLVRRTANVGESVGSLYAVNTFGSGVASLAAAMFVMRMLGESGTIRLAAILNLTVGISAFLISLRNDAALPVPGPSTASTAPTPRRTIPFGMGMFLAAATGFIALAYEIVWYRVYSFATGGTARCFASLLAFYLFGIAYGAIAVHDLSKKKLKSDFFKTLRTASSVVAFGSIAAFLVAPAVSYSSSETHMSYAVTYALVSVAAALLGSAFPILAHATIDPFSQAGKELSYIYLSNIVGSALGSYIVGFVFFEYLSTRAVSILLLVLGFVVASILAFLARPARIAAPLVALSAASLLVVFSGLLYSNLYARLLFRTDYSQKANLKDLVENRHGVIAVDSDEYVYGGGVYDGQFNIDPVNAKNGIFRAYAIGAMHPAPKCVLVIGLSSGSWTQVLTNHPAVQEVTVVEINPGYLRLIAQRPIVSSLLRNPKVHIYIDDGRRWLTSHPDRKFDFVLMNTTFNWRANATNLLSTEFMQIMRQHLNAGGIAYYNTTSSDRVQFTGASVFPYAMRVSNFLAVSDSPIVFDRARWSELLTAYRIDDRPVFDPAKPEDKAAIEGMVSIPDATKEDSVHGLDLSIENRQNLLNRLSGKRPITDDNMGTEWGN